MKVVITGAACTGKTTLANSLTNQYGTFSTPLETVRVLDKLYKMDFTNGNASLQLAALQLDTKLLLDKNNYFLDRSCIDGFVYTSYYKKLGRCDMDEATFRFYEDECRTNMQNYVDLIIFLRFNEIPIVDDGFRVTELSYLQETDKLAEETIKRWNLEGKTITPHGDNIEERIKFCKKYLERLF